MTNIIRTQAEIADATTADLVATYNALTGKSIKKFSSRAAGEAQVSNAILAAQDADAHTGVPKHQRAVARTPAELQDKAKTRTTSTGATVVVKPASAQEIKRTAAKARKAAAKKSPVRKTPGSAKFTGSAKITVLEKTNPKRGTAAKRYALYRDGMTVDAYIGKGGQRRDVVWDLGQGWIRVTEA